MTFLKCHEQNTIGKLRKQRKSNLNYKFLYYKVDH
jgi:transposase